VRPAPDSALRVIVPAVLYMGRVSSTLRAIAPFAECCQNLNEIR
jgi:hypothetical protein